MIKKNQKVWVLYVNLTSNYISFKIEEGKYLGEVNDFTKATNINRFKHVVEHYDDEVNFLSREDIFETENDAYRGLQWLLSKKLKNCKPIVK